MRMLIGNSFGGCLQSIMNGEVSEDEVLVIITRTDAPTTVLLDRVVKQYHSMGNFGARNSDQYELGSWALEDIQDLACRLFNAGKIHQPRSFGTESNFIHPGLAETSGCWVEVHPMSGNQTPAVVDAYEKYKMLDALTK